MNTNLVRRPGARRALVIFSFINLLNYADRFVISAVKTEIKQELRLSDAETSLPATGMIFVYMVFAFAFGIISDKEIVDRRFILAGAIVFWSIATALAGLAHNLVDLVSTRSLIGIGEAAFATIVPVMIADFFPVHERNIAFAIFYVFVPIGAAVGYGIGAIVGDTLGWRAAFFICGLPGVISAMLVITIENPPRGTFDTHMARRPQQSTAYYADSSTSSPLSLDNSNSQLAQQIQSSENMNGHLPTNTTTTTSITTTYNYTTNSNNNHSNTYHNHDSDNHLRDQQHQHQHQQPQEQIVSNDFPIQAFEPYQDTTPLNPNKTSSRQTWKQEIIAMISDCYFIMKNPHYTISVLGWAANTFALGGLADWLPTFLYRYHHASLGVAGLIVGAATIVGGIGGNILGSKISEYFLLKVKNSYLLIPALFTIPGSLCCILAVNLHNTGLVYALLFLSETLIWTFVAPISTISTNAIQPELRGLSTGLSTLIVHVLGDVISPPIIGAISDSTESLRTALQITWMAIVVSGLLWAYGYATLSPLPLPKPSEDETTQHTTYCELIGCTNCLQRKIFSSSENSTQQA